MDWSELVIMFLFCGIFGRYMVYEPYPWRMLQSLTYQVKICKNKRRRGESLKQFKGCNHIARLVVIVEKCYAYR